jgi:hypothetical protein
MLLDSRSQAGIFYPMLDYLDWICRSTVTLIHIHLFFAYLISFKNIFSALSLVPWTFYMVDFLIKLQ